MNPPCGFLHFGNGATCWHHPLINRTPEGPRDLCKRRTLESPGGEQEARTGALSLEWKFGCSLHAVDPYSSHTYFRC